LVSFVWYIEGDLRLRVSFSQMLSRVHTRRVKETRPQAKPAPSETTFKKQTKRDNPTLGHNGYLLRKESFKINAMGEHGSPLRDTKTPKQKNTN